MPEYYSGNYWLSMSEMQVNARYIYDYLIKEGWTLNAVSGLLGNTQTESHHNPGIWQNLAVNKGPGYGLTQWSPYSKYFSWCNEEELEPDEMETALKRILYEVANPNVQWVTHNNYSLTFKEFTKSDKSPYYLAMTFLNNYEMPGNINQPARGTQAEYWYNFLSGEKPPTPGPGEGGQDRNVYNRGKPLTPAIYARAIINRKGY